MEFGVVGVGGRYACRYRYDWRGLRREVWVAQHASAIDAILSRWRPTLSTIPFDVEYHPQSPSEPAIVSLALSPTVALLWHRPDLNRARRVPHELARILTSERFPKVGFAIDNDITKLAKSTDLLSQFGWPKGLFDIQTLYRILTGKPDAVGMEEVVNAVSRIPFTKAEHSGDWARKSLSDDQVLYAAGDAFATWDVVRALQPQKRESKEEKEKQKEQQKENEEMVLLGRVAGEAMGFLVGSVPEERLPRRGKLGRFLACSCPAISRQAGLSPTEKSKVARCVVKLMLRNRWLVPQGPNRLLYNPSIANSLI